ncbi:HU family DNA-binding protein [Candidatus Riflebacteria bacterium]
MHKKELIKRIAKKIGETDRKTALTIQTFLDEFILALGENGRMEFRNFGVFQVKKQKERIIIHPKTGAKIKRPAKNVVLFTASKKMKEIVNKAAGAKKGN